MRKAGVFVLLLAAACAAHASKSKPDTIQAPANQEIDAAREDVRLAYIYIRNNNTAAATETLDRVLHTKGFAQLPDDLRYVALLLAGGIAEDSGKHAEAHDLLVRASEFSRADNTVWHARLASAFESENYPDSALCVATIAKRWPSSLDEINQRAIYTINTELGDAGAQVIQRDYLQALFDAGWRDSDGEPSEFWRELARLWLAAGDQRKALTAAARIQSAREVLAMRVDRQFDAITRANPRGYDVERVAAAEINAARELVKTSPDNLRPLVRLQALLLGTRHYDEVLAIADEVVAKVRDGRGPSIYKDFDDQYIWLLDERSRALARLGRWDEAVEQWERAARRPEQGAMNVSQIINLAQLYADLKRPKDALEAVQELGNASAFGRMQVEIVQLEAAIVQQDQAAVTSHLAYMREHRTDAIATWQTALLLNGDLDGAADLLVERLGSEKWRSAALSDMQQYADTLSTPMDTERLQRWRAVIAQPKVQQALAKVGRIEKFNLDPVET